jgi:sugar transferase (PEP-CTERM/EpsH1 system associated)
MELLYFAHQQILPVNTGARMRNYQLARQLSKLSSVTLVEMTRFGEEKCVIPHDSSLASVVTVDKGRTYTPSKILRGLVGPTPVTVLNCWSTRSASRLAEVLNSRHFDSAQIEGTQLMAFLPAIQESLQVPAIVVDWHNIESEIMRRYAKITRNWAKKIVAMRTAELLERAEDRLLSIRVTHTVTSERERQILLARCPGANIQVIPNGVDTAFFMPRNMADVRDAGQANSKSTILFVGSMDYQANIDAVTWFSRTAWPEIAQTHPNLGLTIVGRDPVPEIRAMASDRIRVTGTVDDVRPYYASAVAAVVPIRTGGGTRLKILEAMAAGVPVISTRLGAEGLDAEHDVHLLLADDGPQIAAAIHRIVSSPETRSRLSRAARRLVCSVYDWSVIGQRLRGIHADLVESSARNAIRRVS